MINGIFDISNKQTVTWLRMAGILAFSRLVTILSLPYSGLLGYGDLLTYFRVAEIPGWPYLQSWAEYPPIFPFLSELIYRLSSGVEHTYVYLMVFLFLLADLASLGLFLRIAWKIFGEEAGQKRA